MKRLACAFRAFVRDVRGQAATVWVLMCAALPMLLIGTAMVWSAITVAQRQHMSVAGDAAALAAARYAVYSATLAVSHHDHTWTAASCGKGCVKWQDDGTGDYATGDVTGAASTLFVYTNRDGSGLTIPGWAAVAGCNTFGQGVGSAPPPIQRPGLGETWTWVVCTGWTRLSLSWVYPHPGAACAAAAAWLRVNYAMLARSRAATAPVPTLAACVAPSDAGGGVTLTVRRPVPELRFGPADTPVYESVHETAHPCSHIIVPMSSAYRVATQTGC